MKISARFDRNTPQAARPAPEPPRPVPQRATSDPPESPAARNLALAHHIDRLIERGLVTDFAAAARMLGVSQPRLTHLMGLLLLAPEIQTAVLFDELKLGDKELRRLARVAPWEEQLARVRHRGESRRLVTGESAEFAHRGHGSIGERPRSLRPS